LTTLIDPKLPVVLQVSALDKAGGAEQVAWNLFKGYQASGISSWLAVGKKRSNDLNIFVISKVGEKGWLGQFCDGLAGLLNPLSGKLRGVLRLQANIKEVGKGGDWIADLRGQEDFHFPGSKEILKQAPVAPSILHLHNLHGGYFDPRALETLSARVPVVLTLHDAWLLSGNCAHSFGCEKWKIGCGNCPDITLYPGLKVDSTAINWQRKKSIFENSRLYIATPSQWLMDKVQESILVPAIVEAKVIPNGVDTRVFYPADKQEVRQALGLPLNEPIILFVANGIKTNVFKDYETLKIAMDLVGSSSANPVHFIALGESGADERTGNGYIRYIPRTTDSSLIAKYYQAADFYIHPSKADTFPNSILEAMACGLPVIASNVGGIPEQVDDGLTGLLVPPQDSTAFAQAIHYLLKHPVIARAMGDAALNKVKLHYTLDKQIATYLDWYQKIITM
jgi:glycosyltransferase involved in cell wall biosynthesis